jgi:hypothetical protein
MRAAKYSPGIGQGLRRFDEILNPLIRFQKVFLASKSFGKQRQAEQGEKTRTVYLCTPGLSVSTINRLRASSILSCAAKYSASIRCDWIAASLPAEFRAQSL